MFDFWDISLIIFAGCKKEKNYILTTLEVTEIAGTTAKSGGEMKNEGGIKIIEMGICWNSGGEPTVSDNKIIDSLGQEKYVYLMEDLMPGSHYFVRAYVISDAGTGYRNTLEFDTKQSETPLVNTLSIDDEDITTTTVTCKGNIETNGGARVLKRGSVLSNVENVTLENCINSLVEDGEIEVFQGIFSDLVPETRYYVRAYATNVMGIAYGKEISFLTKFNLPKMEIVSIDNIEPIKARCKIDVDENGGYPITEFGVCYSNYSNPTIYSSIIRYHREEGLGIKINTLYGLKNNTEYYVRAYAEVNKGSETITYYGEETIFNTLDFPNCGTVTDYDGNVYETVKIGNQCWMRQDLRTTHFSDGTPIDELDTNSKWGNSKYPIGYSRNGNTNFYKIGAVFDKRTEVSVPVFGNLQGVCPTGWHVPSKYEWDELINFCRGPDYAGTKLKIKDNNYWDQWNGPSADNESGFSAIGGGYRKWDGERLYNKK